MNPKVDPSEEFLVRQSTPVNYITGFLLILVFGTSLWGKDLGWVIYLKSLSLLLIPGAFLVAAGRRKAVLIKVNTVGIYFREELVTDWDHFSDAILFQDPEPGAINDRFFIMVKYTKGESLDLFGRKIPMLNTQDKADEEIIAAIQKFYNAALETQTNRN
jgi:hypothetical protein